MNYFDTHLYQIKSEESYKRTEIILIILLLLALIFGGYVFWDRATEHIRFTGGTVVDKYRDKYGCPYVLVLKEDSYRGLDVTNGEYLKYDIGDIYSAQE